MAMPGPSTSRAGRPRKSSTAATQPPSGTGTGEPSTASALGHLTAHMSPSGPSTVAECEMLAQQLLDPKISYRRKLEISGDLRDTAESNRDYAFYEKYLNIFVPVLVTLLSDEKTIVFVRAGNTEWKLRANLLTFLHRLPHSEPYKHHESAIMALMINLLKVENEENAITCIKILVDGFRTHKDLAEAHVDAFLEIVKQMYANIKGVVEKEFSKGRATSTSTDTAAKDDESSEGQSTPVPVVEAPPQSAANPPKHLAPALYSPKVLTECPIAVVLIFQTYKQIMSTAMLDFYPLVFESIKIQPEPQRIAHEKAKEKGEIFVGVSEDITNREFYADLIKAQVKTMAFLAYVLRGSQANVRDYIEMFPEACVRLLRDCPPEDVSTRKEMLVATRHILTIESKTSFLPYMDMMLEERVLVGTGITSRESLRALAYSVVADLVHHTRADIPAPQVAHVIYIFSCALNDTTFPSSIQTMCAKLLNTMGDLLLSKLGPEPAAKAMRSMFFAALQKLSAMCDAYDRLKTLGQRDKGKGKEKAPVSGDKDKVKAKGKDADGDAIMTDDVETDSDKLVHGWREIEQAMLVHQVTYANDSLENFMREARYLFKTLLHLFRTLLTMTRHAESPLPQPDGEQLGELFRCCIRALSIFEGMRESRETREPKETIEVLIQILMLLEPHTFREIWSVNMDFFIEHSLGNMHVFSLIQVIIPHEAVSHQLVAITLKYLMERLDDVGSYPKPRAALTLRLFKMSFLAINSHITSNEAVLVPHLHKLIMRSFALAPKSQDPIVYYQILRALFRSIGGGRFEALYKEVLPILNEMLDNLSYLLQHARDDAQRDLFVELTLTVPVRLTNLLPHLSYLMRPIVYALQAGPELVSQGLRTLELCIDNLTADFLDPMMAPVYRDLMSAVHQLLKPIPANRGHATIAVKVLGKLGGRNRRFPEVENLLEYKPVPADVTAPIAFEGKTHRFDLEPLVTAANKAIESRSDIDNDDSLQVLQLTVVSALQSDKHDPEGTPVFRDALSGLLRASCQKSPIADKATEFVRALCRRLFVGELRRNMKDGSGSEDAIVLSMTRRRPLAVTSALIETFIATLAASGEDQRTGLTALLAVIVTDFKALAYNPDVIGPEDRTRDIERFVHHFFHRFSSLCYEEDWNCKMAGVAAMNVFVRQVDLSRRNIIEHELEFVRTLLFALRDAPKDTARSVDDVTSLIHHLIRTCQSQDDGKGSKLPRLLEILVRELNSQKQLSREAAQSCIALLAEVVGSSVSDLVTPVARQFLLDKDKGPIFLKPLRALPFPVQIGHIDCVNYLLNIRPAVPEVTDEFVRLVQEVVALADVDDASLLAKPSSHRQEYWLKTLRVSCLKMLHATMEIQEFADRANLAPVRQRILNVYFKHVYTPQPEIVDAAHEGLRSILRHQSKLPKEVLQQGLRPILVNLADARRLSVSGLEGLARFLELLHNYFKVEIGIKLLDHFETLGEAAVLAKASAGPLDDNQDIARMARLVNIFRLLPPAAVMYMQKLTTRVSNAEAALFQSTPGPFTDVLGKYLDRYADEGATNLIDNISNPRMVATYQNIMVSGSAPKLVDELAGRMETIIQACFSDAEQHELVIAGLHIIRALSTAKPELLTEREPLESLVGVWRTIVQRSRDASADMSGVQYQIIPRLLLDMFMASLERQQHVALLFHLVEAYEIRSAFDRSAVAFFLYKHAALQESTEYKRSVIDHFMLAYDSEPVTWNFKTNALRLVINPTLLVEFNDKGEYVEGTGADPLLTKDAVTKMSELMFEQNAVRAAMAQHNDSLMIEIYRFTTLLIRLVPTHVEPHRKHVFVLAWSGVNQLEPTVKLTAYVLTSRFMKRFETPLKFTRLTWVGLLRLKDNESRALYREALDVLASCLGGLTVREPSPAGAIPEWARQVRVVLVDEGHQTGTLVTVCELLVNHPDLFFDYRELYVPYIATSLNKLGFVQAATADMKKLSVDVVELIYKWEKRRMAIRDEAIDIDNAVPARDSASPVKRQRLDRGGTAVSSHSGGGWAAPSSTKELVIAHLLRLVTTSQEAVARGGLSKRALDLFKDMLGPKGLPNVLVKMAFFTRSMAQDITEHTIATIANSTEAIAALGEVRDQQWVKSNLETLRRLLEKVWVFDDAALHEVIRPLTERMFAEMPDEEVADATDDGQVLLKWVATTVNNGLVSSLRAHAELPGIVFLLRCWLKVQPKQLLTDSVASGLVKVLSALVKHHTTVDGPDGSHRHIISILDLVRDRISELKDQRRHLLNVLVVLIDKSDNQTLCRYLLELVRQWVVTDVDGPLLSKDKAMLLLRMAAFETRDSALFKQYLDLIYDVYELDALSGTDITHRLEPAFLLGTRSKDPAQRARFLDKLEQTLPRPLHARLQYLYSLQNWETLADSYWIPQLLSLILGVADGRDALHRRALPKLLDDDAVAAAAWRHADLIRYMRNLIHVDQNVVHRLWVAIFPACWASLSRSHQQSLAPYVTKLLAKDYHKHQAELRPNIVKTSLEALTACKPPITVPPLLVKYLAKTFHAWHAGFEILTALSDVYRADDVLRDTCATALSELYAELGEDDMYYGLARGRCVFPETTAGLTYEQNGKWPAALEAYEAAQVKARSGVLPFSEEEYCLWEDHWILAAQKLQHWDSLTELARVDSDPDLLLECAWRLSDWGSPDREMIDQNLKLVSAVPTPRRKIFEAYTALIKAHGSREQPNEFLRVLDEAQQVAIRKWVSLPTSISGAHLPLLQLFQQVVELTEASTVFESLQMTTAHNLEMRVTTDLKGTFTAWRERLPNFWDDISVWSDLLAWRQHIFQAVTKVYIPMIAPNETATHGYRGYHETAWMINRFGEVARRHGLLEVCATALNRIYSLPNIEISEAFLKLREQALCYFQKPDKFNEGLDNISTTNLVYFAPAQKAEFLMLKGMFVSQLGQDQEANAEFAHAVQMDFTLPKAWAEWGKFNEKMYRQQDEAPPPGSLPEPAPGEERMTEAQWAESWAQDRALRASSAVSCYMQAAILYSNHKSRALHLRILWLLGLDDSHNNIAKAFEQFKNTDSTVWYWITLIPQLLMSLSHREAKIARQILLAIAKKYPQALFYNLRVCREDFGAAKKQQQAQLQRQAAQARKIAEAKTAANGDATASPKPDVEAKTEPDAGTPANVPTPAAAGAPDVAAAVPIPTQQTPRQPWELADDINAFLKTTHPFPALGMERLCDQFAFRAKPSSEEDIYRFFSALLNDAMAQWSNRGGYLNDDTELNTSTRENLIRFASNLPSELRGAIERDFVKDVLKLREYIRRLQSWRDQYERALDGRPRHTSIDQPGVNMSEFHLTKSEEIEVPGQYVQHIDPTDELVRIARFHPRVEVGRGHGFCFRRITMIGHNGQSYPFMGQMPAARHCRREDRLMQVCRIMNSVLRKRKESRRRNLQFHLPLAVALGAQLRLIQSDSSFITLQDIYDEHAFAHRQQREDAIIEFCEQQRQFHDPSIPKTDARTIQLKTEIMERIQAKMVPETVLTNYMVKHMANPESLWLMRKQFASQTALTAFMTYVFCLNNRAPSRFHLSRKTGQMYMTEVLPSFAPNEGIFQASEAVPFRLTPNMQHFITRTGIEGVVTATITAVANSLTLPEFDLAGCLHLFIRDEVLSYINMHGKSGERPLTSLVYQNVDQFVRRAELMGVIAEARDKTAGNAAASGGTGASGAAGAAPGQGVVNHAVVTFVSQATAPALLVQMTENFMPWF
ncbi:transcription-associated protein 1 [Cryptotrichosporon argae]